VTQTFYFYLYACSKAKIGRGLWQMGEKWQLEMFGEKNAATFLFICNPRLIV
jgi:hypothetical protein